MHLFSVLFTAQTVDRDFRTEEGLEKALLWAKKSRLQKVYVESFREGVFIEEELLKKCRDYFEAAGFLVHGCVTPVGLPRSSNNYKLVGCYSDPATRLMMTKIFERTARVFDVIMIDDFLFTDCTCELCEKARGERSFADYHADIMHEMSLENILKPAKAANPGCKVIIKYPNWYDGFHAKGYDTIRQTEDFDLIWAGTETREPDSREWGRYPQTHAFYLMNWANKLGKGKCMGGWYDPLTCGPKTYLDQARQTILAQAKESMLFCYENLNRQVEIEERGYGHYTPGIEDTEALRNELPLLHQLAYLTETKTLTGVAVPKKPDYDPPKEQYLSPFYGMLGIPVNPEIELDDTAPSVILGTQAVGFPGIRDYLLAEKAKGTPVIVTKGFAEMVGYEPEEGEYIVDVEAGGKEYDRWNLVDMPAEELQSFRDTLTKPLGLTLEAPSRVGLNLYDDDMEVLQNFNDFDVEVKLDLFGRNPKTRNVVLTLPEEAAVEMKKEGSCYTIKLPARAYAVLN